MQKKGNTLAIVLIVLGGLFLLSKMGFLLGGLIGYLVPIALIALGCYGIKVGNKLLGSVFIIIGALSLIGKFSYLFGIIIAVLLILWGVSMLLGKRNYHNRY